MKKILNYTLILVVALTSIIACSSDEGNVTGDEKTEGKKTEDEKAEDVNTGGNTNPSYLFIEDAIFIKYLKEKLNVVVDAKGTITKEEAQKVTEIVCDGDNYSPTSFNGIELFTNLVKFDVQNNLTLKSLDLRKNVKLKSISIKEVANIETLNIESCSELTNIFITKGKIQSLDLKNAPDLKKIEITFASLSSLNLSKNLLKVENLNLNNTLIKSIDLTYFPSLKFLNLTATPLASINLSKNTKLNVLSISNTNVPILDLRNNPLLQNIFYNNNSNKGSLVKLNLSKQVPRSLVKAEFNGHPNLKCVDLDTTLSYVPSLKNYGWTFKNSGTINSGGKVLVCN